MEERFKVIDEQRSPNGFYYVPKDEQADNSDRPVNDKYLNDTDVVTYYYRIVEHKPLKVYTISTYHGKTIFSAQPIWRPVKGAVATYEVVTFKSIRSCHQFIINRPPNERWIEKKD